MVAKQIERIQRGLDYIDRCKYYPSSVIKAASVERAPYFEQLRMSLDPGKLAHAARKFVRENLFFKLQPRVK